MNNNHGALFNFTPAILYPGKSNARHYNNSPTLNVSHNFVYSDIAKLTNKFYVFVSI